LADIIQVTNAEPIVLTDSEKQLASISFVLEGDENEDLDLIEKIPKGGVLLEKKTRNEKLNQDKQSNEAKRREHQKKLATEKQLEGLKRFSNVIDTSGQAERPVFRKFESYRKEALMPKQISDLKVSYC
jgi:nucleosome binding factor SPN SPT16 subunit